ncbi:MAG TPA: site-specific integrase [Saprospiraceae bacterium]|nr:site-specific integrase [Saprospiraceae bacterium]
MPIHQFVLSLFPKWIHYTVLQGTMNKISRKNRIEGSVAQLERLFNEYVNECQFSMCLRSETIRGYKAVFSLFSKVMPEVSTTGELTTEMLNLFFKRIKTRSRIVGRNTIKTGVKSSTIKTQYSKLIVFFKWLCQKGYLEQNPLKNIKAPQVNYDDFRRLEDEEINKIYSAITRCSNNTLLLRRDTVMVSILLFCGIRKGEFVSLHVKDVDIEKKEITIKGETSKSKRTRVLKIHPTLMLHLKDYLKERKNLKTEWLIVSSRGDSGLTREGLKHWVQSIIDKSGVKFHLHEFRHTFACKLAESNVNIFKIQKMMGHQNITMTVKYSRSLQTEDMEEDIGKISF